MQRDDSGAAQACLAQPAHAHQEEQDADSELQRMERNMVEQWSEQQDGAAQQRQSRPGAERGRAPAAQGRHGKHDRERLDHFDQRGQEGGADSRRGGF